jgi:hypothetical protein
MWASAGKIFFFGPIFYGGFTSISKGIVCLLLDIGYRKFTLPH